MDVILVVNDEPRNLVLATTQVLLMNYQVATASIHEDALSIAHLLKPRLIFLDLVLGRGGSGWETIEQLKADPITCDIPIVVISARSTLEDRERAREMGCIDFISKPYSVQQLQAVVKKYAPALES